MNYLVAYTLKHNDNPDTFTDYWMPFLESEGHTLETAKNYMNDIVAKDGGEEGWYLYTISLCSIIESTDY